MRHSPAHRGKGMGMGMGVCGYGYTCNAVGLLSACVIVGMFLNAMSSLSHPNHTPHALSKHTSDTNLVDIFDANTRHVGHIKEEIHIVFSTDCSAYQDFQSIVLIHSALQVGQGKYGGLTRIASGCTAQQEQALTDLYARLFPKDLAHVHFTPDYKIDKKTGKKYDFYNKPFGMRHWMSNADYDHADIIALIDPDMIFLRPITTEVANASNLLFRPKKGLKNYPPRVIKGYPVAQSYGIGGAWTFKPDKFNLTHICGVGSPCLKTSDYDANAFYSPGPPYIAHKDDWDLIVNTWVDFVPRVFERYPHLLAEMYAYAMAAAHHGLRHILLDHYMVSDTTALHTEGWKWVNKLPHVCPPQMDTRSVQGVLGHTRALYLGHELPNLVHYCQFYRIGVLGFQKRRMPKTMFSCNEDRLLVEAPGHAVNLTVKVKEMETVTITATQARNEVFMLCVITRLINDATLFYRNTICPSPFPETVAAKTLNLALERY